MNAKFARMEGDEAYATYRAGSARIRSWETARFQGLFMCQCALYVLLTAHFAPLFPPGKMMAAPS